jgi:2-polyprenyl-3-methyl-5-hydroxy-6-metoxy-1,4-benzoquinol methylase
MLSLRLLRAKIARGQELGWRASLARLSERLSHAFGYRASVRRLAYWLDRYSRHLYDGPYRERPETGPLNLAVKLERQRAGGPFEPPTIALVNRAAVTLLDARHQRILEIGSGTGLFASLAAADPARTIVASEFDAPAREWAATHRARPNIDFCVRRLEDCAPGEFDVIVAIEVIEHIYDFGGLLRACGRVADDLMISTPNRQRSPFTSVDRTPAYSEHVREWNAGEFLWVLRAFYKQVDLFTVPRLREQADAMLKDDAYRPRVESCSDLTCEDALIAVCRGVTDRS